LADSGWSVTTLQELFEVSTSLVHQPLPDGNRVTVLTNAGDLGILCADACEASGLILPALAEETTQVLCALLPPEAAEGCAPGFRATRNAGGEA
jgi:acyl-CoA synthetase (NDP forming)